MRLLTAFDVTAEQLAVLVEDGLDVLASNVASQVANVELCLGHSFCLPWLDS